MFRCSPCREEMPLLVALGAIALALASERPDLAVTATDQSPAALVVAQRNAGRLGLTHIGFAAGDWFGAVGAAIFDVVISNPPYVADDEWATADWAPEVLPERFMDYLLPCLETLHSIDGLIPLFTPLSPGGNYPDLDFLKAAFDIINARGKRHLLEKMAVGIHNYAFNRPPDWNQDHLGFRLFGV